MVALTQVKQHISEALEKLPPESLVEVLQFVEFLRYKAAPPHPKRIVQLYGLWANIPFDVTDDDLRQLRSQATKHFDQDEI